MYIYIYICIYRHLLDGLLALMHRYRKNAILSVKMNRMLLCDNNKMLNISKILNNKHL